MMIVEGSSTIDPWLKNIFNYLGLKRSKKKKKKKKCGGAMLDDG